MAMHNHLMASDDVDLPFSAQRDENGHRSPTHASDGAGSTEQLRLTRRPFRQQRNGTKIHLCLLLLASMYSPMTSTHAHKTVTLTDTVCSDTKH